MNPPLADAIVPSPSSVALAVNGEPVEVPADATIADLIERLGFTGKRIAVERNGTIVPRSRHATEALAAGDRVEIVAAVGGG